MKSSGKFHAGAALTIAGIMKIRKCYLYNSNDQNKLAVRNIISNHVSCLDILYYMSTIYPSFVSKESVANEFFVGCSAKAMKCVFVSKENSDDRKRAYELLMKRQQEIHDDMTYSKPPLVIFPEGTTTNGMGVIEFKKGAFSQLLPLQPIVLIYGSSKFLPSFDILPHYIFLPLLLSNVPSLYFFVFFCLF